MELKPMIRIHNVETDEIIDREMTSAEFNQYKKDEAQSLAIEESKVAASAAKAALLAKLGITQDEAKLLLS
jgi:hypothetical protein